MKKLTAVFTAAALLLLLCGCSGGEEASSSAQSAESAASQIISSEISSEQKTSSAAKTSSRVVSKTESQRPLSKKERLLAGLDEDFYKSALVNEGNSVRIANAMRKAQAGGTVTIAVFGGSISAGALASSRYSSYGYLVNDWWVSNFPDATINFINAGIGATAVEMACYRQYDDLLSYNPDFVIVDFAVNSWESDPPDGYENILRRTLASKNAPGVMCIFFPTTNREQYAKGRITKGSTDAGEQLSAAKKFNVPAIHYDKAIWEKINLKVITWPEIAGDYIHPNDSGHFLAASLITKYLDGVKSNLSKISKTPPALPSGNTLYSTARRYTPVNISSTLGDFIAMEGENASDRGWTCEAGAKQPLKINLPAVKKVRIFYNASGFEGSVSFSMGGKTITAQGGGASPTISGTLQFDSAQSGTLTATPNVTSGTFTMYGVFTES